MDSMSLNWWWELIEDILDISSQFLKQGESLINNFLVFLLGFSGTGDDN